MAGGAADLPERPVSHGRHLSLLVGCRLEVVQQIELEIVHEGRRNLVTGDISVGIEAGIGNGRSLDAVQGAVENHAGGGHDLPLRARPSKIRVGRVQAHLSVQCADDELADRDRPPVCEERPHAQVRIDPFDLAGVDGSVRGSRDRAVVDALGRQLLRHGPTPALGGRDGIGSDMPKTAGDLVSQHLLESEPEEVRRVPAVGTGHDVSSRASGPARASVAAGAAIRKAGSNRDHRIDVADPVLDAWALLLEAGELALKDLATPADRAERIPADEERRRVGSHRVPASRSDLVCQGFVDAVVGGVGRLRLVDHLAKGPRRGHGQNRGHEPLASRAKSFSLERFPSHDGLLFRFPGSRSVPRSALRPRGRKRSLVREELPFRSTRFQSSCRSSVSVSARAVIGRISEPPGTATSTVCAPTEARDSR